MGRLERMKEEERSNLPGKWEVWTVNTPTGTAVGLVIGRRSSAYRVMPIVTEKGDRSLRISEPRFIGMSGAVYVDRTEEWLVNSCDMVSRAGKLGRADCDLVGFIGLDS